MRELTEQPCVPQLSCCGAMILVVGGEGEEAAQARAELAVPETNTAPNTAARSRDLAFTFLASLCLRRAELAYRTQLGIPFQARPVGGAAQQRGYRRSSLLEPCTSPRNYQHKLSLWAADP